MGRPKSRGVFQVVTPRTSGKLEDDITPPDPGSDPTEIISRIRHFNPARYTGLSNVIAELGRCALKKPYRMYGKQSFTIAW